MTSTLPSPAADQYLALPGAQIVATRALLAPGTTSPTPSPPGQ